MKNVSPAREAKKSAAGTQAQPQPKKSATQTVNLNINGGTASNNTVPAPNKPAAPVPGNRNNSKSPNNRKATGSQSNTKTSKPMSKEFILELLGGTDSVSDVNIPSWKGITEKDLSVGISASRSNSANKQSGKAGTAGIYKLGDKDTKVQEPHVLKPPEGGRELGSNDSSTMSMDGEGLTGSAHEELDLDKIDHFRSHKEVDHELVKKIMKLDLNDTEMKNRMKSFYEESMVTPPIKFAKANSGGNKNKSGTSKPKVGTGGNAANKPKEKVDANARPGRHRVIVNERRRSTSSGSQEKKSPYECDWIDLNGKAKPVKEDGNYAAYVTGPEYRLLKKFKNKGNSKTRTAPVNTGEGYGLPNYPAFSTKAPNVSKSPSAVVAIVTTANAPAKVLPPAKPKTTNASIAVQTDASLLASLIPKTHKRTTETQTQIRRVGFNLDGNTVQLYEVDRDDLTSDTVLSVRNENESKCRAVGVKMAGTEAESEDSETDSSTEDSPQLALILKRLFSLNLKKSEDLHTFNEIQSQSVADLEVGILAVAEVSNIILHSIFKDPFPTLADKENALDGDENFSEFLTAHSEKEALGKMVQVFASTCGRIMNHLDLTDAVESILKERGSLGISGGVGHLGISDNSDFTHDERAELEGQHGLELSLATVPARTSTVYSNAFEAGLEPKRNEYAMTLLGKPHQLLQHIYFNNTQFTLIYNANDKMVSSLATANREGFERTPISSEKLYDIVSRNSSYLTGRLTSSKFCMSRVIDDFGLLVSEFLIGKYLKPTLPNSKSPTSRKFKTKLQSLNIYAGVIYQLAFGFSVACKKLQITLAKAMKLKPPVAPVTTESVIGPYNHTTGGTFQRDSHVNLPLETNIPVNQAMEEFAAVIHLIDTILTTGKNSLNSLSRGVKVKSKHVTVIHLMMDAVKQMEDGHGIDFGTVMMGLLSCTGVGDGDLSPETQKNMATSLLKLHDSAGELVRYSKKIGLLASFVASKTLYKIRSMNREKDKRAVTRGSVFGRFLQRIRGQNQNKKSAVPKLKKLEPEVIPEQGKIGDSTIKTEIPATVAIETKPDPSIITPDDVVIGITEPKPGEVTDTVVIEVTESKPAGVLIP